MIKAIEREETGAKILVTHGTDTLIETAKFVDEKLDPSEKKVVVFTGSFLPESFKV